MKKVAAGFSVIELLVVVSIIGILSAVIYANLSEGSAESRDVQRKADLRTLQSAIELYKNDNGRYPEGCNAPGSIGNWSGEPGSAYPCASGSSQYIVGLAPKYIPTLPTDPKLNGASGYMYTVDAEGMVYKIMAENTVESEDVDALHPFARCGNVADGSTECASVPTAVTGNQPYNTAGNTPNECQYNVYKNDYALSGGYANGGWSGVYRDSERAREYFSDKIKCK